MSEVKRHPNAGSVLLLGGTGAMGRYLAPLLADAGYRVSVTSRSSRSSDDPRIEYVRGGAKDPAFLSGVLGSRPWGAVVDFMVWGSEEFRGVYRELLSSCGQYVFLSSYRVFADSPVIREGSPRLLDVCGDQDYLATDEYALAKARQEDLLRGSGSGNWTIVRPAVTYSRGRYQLSVLECYEWLPRVLAGHAVPMPEAMAGKQATMSWGGDVARMISRLVGNPAALGEDFNCCTSRHRTWGEVADVYRRYVPVRLKWADLAAFEHATGRPDQVRYDRMYDRVMDNSKVLRVAGMSESDLLSLDEGIERELPPFLNSGTRSLPVSSGLQGRFDRLTGEFFSPKSLPAGEGSLRYLRYLKGRVLG